MKLDLVGVAEIVSFLGVSRQRVNDYLHRPDFPAPVADLACGKIWRLVDVQLWSVTHPRVSGRPARGRRADDS